MSFEARVAFEEDPNASDVKNAFMGSRHDGSEARQRRSKSDARYQDVRPVTLTTAAGSKVIFNQVAIGAVQLRLRAVDGAIAYVRVERVYFDPRFKSNLLSWQLLVADKWALHSSMAESYVQTPSALGGKKFALEIKDNVSMLMDAFDEKNVRPEKNRVQ